MSENDVWTLTLYFNAEKAKGMTILDGLPLDVLEHFKMCAEYEPGCNPGELLKETLDLLHVDASVVTKIVLERGDTGERDAAAPSQE